MKIIIDADACPVVDIAVGTAKERNLKCILVCDNTHFIQKDGAETIIVDKGADSADCRIANLTEKCDIVITQDYGLAAMCLSKQATVLNQDGREYTNDNIQGLLEFRAVSKKIRQSGGRLKGMPKRTVEQDKAFEKALENILNKSLKGDIIKM